MHDSLGKEEEIEEINKVKLKMMRFETQNMVLMKLRWQTTQRLKLIGIGLGQAKLTV